MSRTFTYGRQEKLKHRKTVEAVFSSGKSFAIAPLRIFYLVPQRPMDHCIKVGVGCSSRIFKKAVVRNRIKRLLREAYRTEKLPLLQSLNVSGKQLAVFILYTGREPADFASLKSTMQAALKKLEKIINENSAAHT